jgi:RNA polymerase sigma factor (sigma-70 family)
MKLRDEQKEFWEQFVTTGDLDCLSKVYFHYYDHFFDYGMRITSDKLAVEDAIQNVYLNLIRTRKKLGKVKNLSAYLISTFRRQLLSDLKKSKKILSSEDLAEDHFEYFRDLELEHSDKKSEERLFRTIDQCINQLSGKQKEILHLRFQKEIPYETISEMLNISVDSCYKSVYRTVNTLRTEVEKIMGEKLNVILFLFALLNFICY